METLAVILVVILVAAAIAYLAIGSKLQGMHEQVIRLAQRCEWDGEARKAQGELYKLEEKWRGYRTFAGLMAFIAFALLLTIGISGKH